MKDVTVSGTNAKAPETTHDALVGELGPSLSRWGYRLISDTPTVLMFERRYIPRWVAIPVILLFPIGLLFLFVKETASLSITIAAHEGGSRVTINGQASRPLRKHLSEINEW